jgi:F0F1-type ATP synthase membrane subunit b/b'
LVTFIRDNIRPGREEKMRYRIRAQVSSLFREIEVELASIGQSEEQRTVSLQKAQSAVKQTQAEYEVLRHQFLKDLRLIQRQHELDLTQGLNRLMQQFYVKIDESKTLADTQNVILTSKKWMRVDVEVLVEQVAMNTRPKIQQLQQTYVVRWAETAQAWEDVQVDLNLEGGILEKVPPFLVNIADYALTILILPFPFFIDLLIRFVAEKIPALEKFIPANLVIAILKGSVKRNCDEQFQVVIEETEKKIAEAYQQAEAKIEQAWKEGVVAQAQAVLDPMQRAQHGGDPGRKVALQAAKTQVQQLLGQL